MAGYLYYAAVVAKRTPVERRKSKRYELRALVVFKWIDSMGVEHNCVGVTLNISPVGVIVLCDGASPPLHTDGTIEVTLPSLQEEREGLHLKSDVQVVRVEDRLDGSAFATTADFQIGEETYSTHLQ